VVALLDKYLDAIADRLIARRHIVPEHDKELALGQTDLSFRTLFTGQVAFPATPVPSTGANVLDEYEEGTWIPSLGGTPTPATYSSRAGGYIKIGQLVWVSFDITVNAINNGSTTGVSGLPFACHGSFNGGVSPAYFGGIATAVDYITGWIGPGNSQVDLYSMTGPGDTLGLNAIFKAGTRFAGFGCYRAAV
jgi:hypothetical protein